MRAPFPCWAEVDLDKLHRNADRISETAKVPLMPVVKANAYGHGASAIARQLSRRKDVAALCVWSLEEALALRKGGIKGRVITLGGARPWEGRLAAETGAEVVVGSAEQARALARAAGRRAPALVHFKVNTGMNRLGSDPEDSFGQYSAISSMKNVRLAGVMTHLASAGGSRRQTAMQLKTFADILSALRAAGKTIPPRHAANTAAIFSHPEACLDLVRPGIGLYGIKEFPGADPGLEPVMTLRAVLIAVRSVGKGEGVSYDSMWISPGKRRVAAAAIGYADGYSRVLSGRSHAIINGGRAPQIGAICMDTSMFDVTKVDASAGDVATLIGPEGSGAAGAARWAGVCGTISYEILCRIGPRVRRIYIRRGKTQGRTGFPAF